MINLKALLVLAAFVSILAGLVYLFGPYFGLLLFVVILVLIGAITVKINLRIGGGRIWG